MNPAVKKSGLALLKFLPGLGSGVAMADMLRNVHNDLGNPASKVFQWKALQAVLALAGDGALLWGASLHGGFHHPGTAATVIVGGAHLLAGAGEFVPERIQRPILHTLSRTAALVRDTSGPAKEGFSFGRGR